MQEAARGRAGQGLGKRNLSHVEGSRTILCATGVSWTFGGAHCGQAGPGLRSGPEPRATACSHPTLGLAPAPNSPVLSVGEHWPRGPCRETAASPGPIPCSCRGVWARPWLPLKTWTPGCVSQWLIPPGLEPSRRSGCSSLSQDLWAERPPGGGSGMLGGHVLPGPQGFCAGLAAG